MAPQTLEQLEVVEGAWGHGSARADQARRLVGALADGLVRRGVDEQTASLAAQTGAAAFRVAFERWLADPGDRSLADTLRDSFDRLSTVIAGG